MIAALPTIKKMAHAFHHKYHWHPELDVDDLVQEGSVAVWASLPNADRTATERYWAYLHARMRGAFMDYFRAVVGKGQVVELDALENEKEQDSVLMDFAYPSPEDHAMVISFLRCIFKGLSETERYVMMRVTVDGDRLAVVGRSIGVSESRVSQIVSEARKKMKAETCL